MDIFATCAKIYRTGICVNGGISAGKRLPLRFFRGSKTLPPVVGALNKFLVNKAGLGLLNSITSPKDKYNSSICVSCELVGAVMGERSFSTLDYIWSVK